MGAYNYTSFLYQGPEHSEYWTVVEFFKYKLDNSRVGRPSLVVPFQ